MPIVNGKHYPYTAAGRKAAKKAAMKGKKKINIEAYHAGRGKVRVQRGTKLSVALGKRQY